MSRGWPGSGLDAIIFSVVDVVFIDIWILLKDSGVSSLILLKICSFLFLEQSILSPRIIVQRSSLALFEWHSDAVLAVFREGLTVHERGVCEMVIRHNFSDLPRPQFFPSPRASHVRLCT